MTQSFKTVLLALALGACASGGDSGDGAPVAPQLRSEFASEQLGGSQYGPFVAATLAQHNDEHSTAARYYLQALKADPESYFVADRAFFQLLYSGHTAEAATVAADLVGSDAQDIDDLVHLTSVLEAYARSDWPTVRARLDKHTDAGFGFLVGPILGAWSYAGEQDIAGAEAALEPLIKDPRLEIIGREHLAYIYDYMGLSDKAKQAYLGLIDADTPVAFQTLVAYADMLARIGERDAAREFLGEKTKEFKDNRYLLREGMRILSGGKPSQATASPRGAASAIFHRLATEFAQSGSMQAAVIYLRLASYMTPGVEELHYLVGTYLEQLGNPNEAVTAYMAVPATSPLKGIADIRRIGALRTADRTGEAEDLVRDALRDNPDNGMLITTLADILREKTEFSEAAAYYSQAIDQVAVPTREDWFKYFARGVCFEQMKEWAKAEQDLLMALKLNPGEATVLNYLGYSWIDRGKNVDEAKRLIEQAVEATPDDGFIVDSLGWVNYLTGDFDKAVTLLEKAVRLEPDDATINAHLGDAYWRTGRKIEARFQWRHALESDPSEEEKQALQEKLEYGLPKLS